MTRRAWRAALGAVGCAVSIAAWGPPAGAQGIVAPARRDTGHAAEGDGLGRDTPRGTVMGFLRAAEDSDFKRGAQYLQLSQGDRATEGQRMARRLAALLNFSFVGRAGPLSDRPEGSGGAGSSRDRIGTFRIDTRDVDVELVRVSDVEDHDIWLFSSRTLAEVPALYEEMQRNRIEPDLPGFLVNERLLSTPLWGWLAFLLMIPVTFAIAWGIVRLGGYLYRRYRRKRGQSIATGDRYSLAPPITLVLTVALHQAGITLLGLPLIFRLYNYRVAGLVIAFGAAWLVFQLINRWGERARLSALAGAPSKSSAVVLLGQRLLKLLVVIITGLVILSIFGVNTTAAVAGLGIGSLAIAFAAQKTLDNLLGGISILGDQVIRVGELCRIGNKEGVVEDISLRSTRIRTPERTELSIPNGQLATMSVENLSRRDMMQFRTMLRLRLDTTPDQLRSLLSSIQDLLHRDRDVMRHGAIVRLVGFGAGSLDVEIDCNVLTTERPDFLRIREGLLLQIVDLVSEAGTDFAAPMPVGSTVSDQDAVRHRVG